MRTAERRVEIRAYHQRKTWDSWNETYWKKRPQNTLLGNTLRGYKTRPGRE